MQLFHLWHNHLLIKKKITIELAKIVVENLSKTLKKKFQIDHIQKVVSDYFQMDVTTLQSKTRKRHIVQARQLAMFFQKSLQKLLLQA